MQRYILKRLGQSLLTLLGISILVFVLIRLTGDPSVTMLPADATPADRALFRHELGLDRPITTQYGIFLSNALRGNLGNSLMGGQPALHMVMTALGNTLRLVAFTLVLSVAAGMLIGIGSAVRPHGFLDRFGCYLTILGQSAPAFWVGIMLMLLFSVKLRVLPTSGMGGLTTYLMPAFTLGWFSMAAITRVAKSAMLAVLDSDYIKMAWALGTPHRQIVFKYALRNAAIPLLTMTGIQLIGLIGGTVLVESVFAWPGLGRLAVTSVSYSDFTVLQAFVLVYAGLVAVINLVVDVLYAYLDPRVRFE